jgi:hypothetical protein
MMASSVENMLLCMLAIIWLGCQMGLSCQAEKCQ